jgi:hypothetical protein
LFALSVSSRADALPRLSRQLRALSSGIGDKRSGRVDFDPAGFLQLNAATSALVTELAGLDSDTPMERRMSLMGEVRQAYAELPDQELYGLGAHAWRTRIGASGVSGYFYAPGDDRWFSAGPARGSGHDTHFDPIAAYSGESLWGAGPLATLSKSRLLFQGGTASVDGRLSSSATTRVEVHDWRAADAIEAWPVVFTDWQELQAHCRRHFRPGLLSPTAALPVLLMPSPAWFDELAQRLIWPLADEHGDWIGLSLSQGVDERGFDDVERLSQQRPRLVTALVRALPSGYRLTPIAWLGSNGDAGLHAIGLDGHQARPTTTGKRLWGLGAKAAAMLRSQREFRSPVGRSASADLIAEVMDALSMWTEVGDAALPRFAPLATAVQDIGHPVIANALSTVSDSSSEERPQAVLIAVYLLGLLGGLKRELEWLEEDA